MTTSPSSDPTIETPERFPSLPALRAAHAELLQRRRLGEDTPEFPAAARAFIRQGRGTGAILDDESERLAAQSLLDFWANRMVRADLEAPEATLAEFDPTLAPELPDEPCPYRGLDAFHSTDRPFFFGRQRLLEQLLDHLRQNHLLAVIGSSGSGKSSLVLAGLAPALQAGSLPGSEDWCYVPPLTPGSDPLASLARAVARSAPDGATEAATSATSASKPSSTPIDHAVAQFLQNPDHLSRLLGDPPGAPAVVVVDQFEEIFTLCRDEPMRQAFVANLLRLLDLSEAGHIVVLTMRTDFVDNVARLPALQERFEQAAVRVTPLSAGELREAITSPAAVVGLKFEEGVVDALVHDILGEPAGLPLLQFTLLKLWEKRERNRVTWEAYRRLGGGRLALAHSADEFYDNLIPEEQVTCKRILLRLVRPGEGLEVTSNRVRRQSLYGAGEARDRVDRVLDKLIAARLIRQTAGDTPADAQVEVAHEALVRNWPRLVAWLDEERVRLRARLRLTASAEQWARLNRDPSGLLRGALLDEALSFSDLTELEAAFVQTSQSEAQRRAEEREAARQRELDQAHALAEEQRLRAEVEAKRAEEQTRSALRLRRLVTALIAIFIVAGLILFYAFGQQQQAQQSALAAQRSALGAAAAYTIATVNAATAAASERLAATRAAEATKDQATAVGLYQVAQDALMRNEATLVYQLATSTASATPSPTRTPTSTRIGIQPSPTPYNATPTPRPLPTPTPVPVNLAATATTQAMIQAQLNQVRATQTAIAKVRPGRGQGNIAYASDKDGNPEIYVVKADGTGQTRLTNYPGDDWSPAWSPSSRRIAFTSTRGNRAPGVHNLFVMDADGSDIQQLTHNQAWDEYAAWSPDERRIAFASTADNNAEIFTINLDGTNLQRLTRQPTDDINPTWSPDGRRLAFSSNRTGKYQIYMMDADGSNQTRITTSDGNDLHPVWSPNGGQIVFFSDRDGNPEIYVMKADGSGQTRLTKNTVLDKDPTWSPDGSAIAFWTNRQGSNDLYVMWADGSYQVRLASGPVLDGQLSWGR